METNTNKPQQKKKNWFLALGFSLLLSTFLVFLSGFLYYSKDSIPRLTYLIFGSMSDGAEEGEGGSGVRFKV
jgi:hypothetical protein